MSPHLGVLHWSKSDYFHSNVNTTHTVKPGVNPGIHRNPLHDLLKLNTCFETAVIPTHPQLHCSSFRSENDVTH